jgi:hypothetical protein
VGIRAFCGFLRTRHFHQAKPCSFYPQLPLKTRKFFFGQTQITQTDLMSFAGKLISYLKGKGVTIKEE